MSNFSFANTVIKNINFLIKSVIYDSECSDFMTYDKNRFLKQIKLVANRWIDISNDRMKVKDYDIMQMLEKSEDKVMSRDVITHNTEDCESRVLMIERSQI